MSTFYVSPKHISQNFDDLLVQRQQVEQSPLQRYRQQYQRYVYNKDTSFLDSTIDKQQRTKQYYLKLEANQPLKQDQFELNHQMQEKCKDVIFISKLNNIQTIQGSDIQTQIDDEFNLSIDFDLEEKLNQLENKNNQKNVDIQEEQTQNQAIETPSEAIKEQIIEKATVSIQTTQTEVLCEQNNIEVQTTTIEQKQDAQVGTNQSTENQVQISVQTISFEQQQCEIALQTEIKNSSNLTFGKFVKTDLQSIKIDVNKVLKVSFGTQMYVGQSVVINKTQIDQVLSIAKRGQKD